MKFDGHRALALALLASCCLASSVEAQQDSKNGSPDLRESMDRMRDQKAPGLAGASGPALESTILPDFYVVGPSDVLSVNVWITPPANLLLTVTPEGTLIIPTVGEVAVSGLTLSQAKRKIVEQVRVRYRYGDATVTLVSPRPIIVTVVGSVLNPGTYTTVASSRVGRIIEEANRLRAGQVQWQADGAIASMSRRNIVVRHHDGTISHVDLDRYAATSGERWNGFLREGDVVVVPQNDLESRAIGVYGAVNVPGRYEFASGDSIGTVLLLAHGFHDRAQGDSVEFSRLAGDGKVISMDWVDGAGILAGRVPDISMRPGDRLYVRPRPDERGDYRVLVTGEVRFPGTYPIAENTTRLSEVIRRAGGFTTQASLRRAELIRGSVPLQALALERLMSLRGGVTPEDSAYYYLETDLRLQREMMDVDFLKLMEGDSTQDVILQSEDRVVIPTLCTTIYVFGQVVSPGNVTYIEGESVDYYLRQAGGFTDRARPGDVRIVKAKTRQWLSPEETSIEEGDYLWVPKDPERSFAYYMGIIGQTASILGVAVSITLLVIQVTRN